ncbi:MAG: hypothetical protein HQ513_13670 [Rhodospirillales bacterium]|nr:hypothetical protein [Rhodospirillales bacterium]
MAQIPKNLPPVVSTSVSAGRLQGNSRSVASTDATPIEEANAQDGVLFNDALLFEDDKYSNRNRKDNAQGNQLIEYAGSSQTFASIFESGNATSSGGDVQRGRQKGFASLIARAINTYETNVQVIQGTIDPRGSTISMSL